MTPVPPLRPAGRWKRSICCPRRRRRRRLCAEAVRAGASLVSDGQPARITVLRTLGRLALAGDRPGVRSDSCFFADTAGRSDAACRPRVAGAGHCCLAATAHTVTDRHRMACREGNALRGLGRLPNLKIYLSRAEAPDTGIAAANARLRSLLSPPAAPEGLTYD